MIRWTQCPLYAVNPAVPTKLSSMTKMLVLLLHNVLHVVYHGIKRPDYRYALTTDMLLELSDMSV